MNIDSPLSEKAVRGLNAGDVVHLSGRIVTGRDKVHMRAMSEDSEHLHGATVFHCGPIMAETKDGWEVIAAGPTTSARMNTLEPEFIRRYGIRGIIGKGGMDHDVLDAMREVGCVYLAATGGAAVSLASSLTAEGVEWKDLGMAEAMWIMNANNMGPLVVAMDAHGNSLYENVTKNLKR